MDDREMYNALTDKQQKIIINIMKWMLKQKNIPEAKKDTEALEMAIEILEEYYQKEAKKDIRALGITLALLEERKKQYGGSEEIYTKQVYTLIP